MPTQFQTSFVPKAPLPAFGKERLHISISAFGVVAVILLVIAIGVSGGLFIYKRVLIQDINAMNDRLAATKKAYEPGFIDEAVRLSRRIEAAKKLLATHISVPPLFDLLERETLENVRFRDFNFTSGTGGVFILSMTGEAKSFNAVALQSDVFGEEKSFKNPVFSNFLLDEGGNVIFNFRADIDPALLSYTEASAGRKEASAPSVSNLDGEDVAAEDADALDVFREESQ